MEKINQWACYNSIWSWSPMPCEKHGSGLSNDKNLGIRPRFLSTESLGPCFHTAWETMIKSYNHRFSIEWCKTRKCLLKSYKATETLTYIDVRFRKTIYNSFIMDNLYYCSLSWHFWGKTLQWLAPLTTILNRFNIWINECLHIRARLWPQCDYNFPIIYKIAVIIVRLYSSTAYLSALLVANK